MRYFFLGGIFLFMFGIPNITDAASLSLSPAQGTYGVGDRVSLTVLVSSDAPLNAVSGVLSFPSGLFAIQSVTKGNSILNFWVTEPTFSTSDGIVKFEGVSLSGFQGNGGSVVTVTLRALKQGSGTVSFQSGQVLANDGQGTDITGTLSGGTYQIQPAKIQPVVAPSPPPAPVEEVAPAVVPSLTAPAISLALQNDLPTIFGTSVYPRAKILLTFVPVTGSKLFITGTADGDGNFVFPVPQALRNGAYAVNAVMVLDTGAQTSTSNTLTVEVGGAFVADVSWESATYASLFLIVLLGAVLGYFVWRRYFGPRRTLPKALKKEVKEAEAALHKSFGLLQQDLTDHLGNRTSAGAVDRIEREDITSLKKDLKEAEEYIEKELDDIESLHGDEKE